MTPLVRETLAAAGLLDVLEARRKGETIESSRIDASADLLALGALADVIRREEVGDTVHVYASTKGKAGAHEPRSGLSGLALLRDVALLRITSPRGARVRVDWGASTLEIAQVALGFGASELQGPIANRRGLPIADDATKKVKGQGMVSLKSLQQKEIERVLRSAGRQPVFDDAAASDAPEAASHG